MHLLKNIRGLILEDSLLLVCLKTLFELCWLCSFEWLYNCEWYITSDVEGSGSRVLF